MIQYKPGDLTRWSYREHPRENLLPRFRLPVHLRFQKSLGLILKVLKPEEVFELEEIHNKRNLYLENYIKNYVPVKEQPYLWFSLKQKNSLIVFQDELSLVKRQ